MPIHLVCMTQPEAQPQLLFLDLLLQEATP